MNILKAKYEALVYSSALHMATDNQYSSQNHNTSSKVISSNKQHFVDKLKLHYNIN